MTEFLSMGVHAPFVWGSFAVTAVVLVIEVIMVRARRRAAIAMASEGARP